MLLVLHNNLQGYNSPVVNSQVFGAHDDGGAEALARKTVANRKKAEAELAEIQRKALEATQKQVQVAAERTESTPNAIKRKSKASTKVTLDFSVLDKQIYPILLPEQIPDDLDMELVMAMLLID